MRASFLLLVILHFAAVIRAADEFPRNPLSEEDPAVPKGTLTKMRPWDSKIFAGTTRDWWVYVPAQYRAMRLLP
jgi:enterochelin esterase family protein